MVTRVFNETTVKQGDISSSKYHQMVVAIAKRKAQNLKDISKGVQRDWMALGIRCGKERQDTNKDKKAGRGEEKIETSEVLEGRN